MRNDIQAIILAGGLGTRLRPLTCTMPKPMASVLGESVLERLFRLLPQWGVQNAAVSTMYLSEKISDAFGQCSHSVKLHYVKETVPVGNAGGAKLAAAALDAGPDDTFLILSGDGIFDFDLTDAIQRHRETDADVTIVTFPSNEPLEYGVVCSDTDGRITAFCEKPPWSQVCSDTVNTGIYLVKSSILQTVPDGREFDFSRDLFPLLLGNNKRLYAHELRGYWCDIGDVAAYYRCNRDALDGKIKDVSLTDAFTCEELRARSIDFEAPCFVSRSAVIENDVHIGKHSVIGKNARLHGSCRIDAAILLENVEVGKNSRVGAAVIGENTVVGKDVQIKNGCVIGGDCRIADGAVVQEQLSIWAGKTVEKGVCVTDNIIFEKQKSDLYTDTGYYAGEVGTRVASDYLSRLGRAIAGAVIKVYAGENSGAGGRIGVMHDGSAESVLIADSLLCGIRSAGSKSFSFLKGFEAQARYAASAFMTDLVLYVTREGEKRVVKAFDRLSVPPSRDFERAAEAIFRDLSAGSELDFLYGTEYDDGLRFRYYSDLLQSAEEDFGSDDAGSIYTLLKGVRCYFPERIEPFSPNHMVRRAILELGGEVVDEYGENTVLISLSASGTQAEMDEKDKDGNRVYFDSYHIVASLIAYSVRSKSRALALPYLAPAVYSELLRPFSGETRGYLTHANHGNTISRRYIAQSRWVYDMCFAVIRLLCLMKREKKGLHEIAEALPLFEINVQEIGNDATGGENRAAIMRKLTERYAPQNSFAEHEGIRVTFRNGHVTVVPRRTGGFRLITEAVDSETAEELCSSMKDEIACIGLDAASSKREKPVGTDS